MRNLDFSSWQAVMTTLLGLVVGTVIMVGIRLLVMGRVQQRRQSENRQINERLRTLIAAYKTLGGSFTGDLAVDPTHLGDFRRRETAAAGEVFSALGSFDRSRRIRDAVEAALSDVILLGTEEQVRLAAQAASELAAGRPVHTHDLVISLRDFIRKVLDLEPVPAALTIPKQGPTRPGGAGASGGRGKGAGGSDRGDSKEEEGRGAIGETAMGGGMGLGMGGALGRGSKDEHHPDDEERR